MVIIVRLAKRNSNERKEEDKAYYANGKWVKNIDKADRFTREEAIEILNTLPDKYIYSFLYEVEKKPTVKENDENIGSESLTANNTDNFVEKEG